MARKRTQPVRGDVIEKLRESRALSLEKLALAADVNVRTLKRIIAGKEPYLGTIQAVAKALGTTPEHLYADTPREGIVTRFTLDLSLKGELKGDPAMLEQITSEVINVLTSFDMKIGEHKTKWDVAHYSTEHFFLYYVCGYAPFCLELPFWMFLAVPPAAHPGFIRAMERGEMSYIYLDIYGFTLGYGEGFHPRTEGIEAAADILGFNREFFEHMVCIVIDRLMPDMWDIFFTSDWRTEDTKYCMAEPLMELHLPIPHPLKKPPSLSEFLRENMERQS